MGSGANGAVADDDDPGRALEGLHSDVRSREPSEGVRENGPNAANEARDHARETGLEPDGVHPAALLGLGLSTRRAGPPERWATASPRSGGSGRAARRPSRDTSVPVSNENAAVWSGSTNVAESWRPSRILSLAPAKRCSRTPTPTPSSVSNGPR